MFFRFLFLYIAFGVKSHLIFAQQDPYYFKWDAKVLEAANTAKDAEYLNSQEKKVIYYTNLARMNPQLFVKTYMQLYLKRYGVFKGYWYWKMYKQIKHQEPLPPLVPDKTLFEFAKKHAKEMGLAGKKGHRNTKGEFYADRIKPLQNEFELVKENIQYGYWEALAIVCDLLLDEQVKTGSHRKLIFYPNIKYIGVSIQAHKKFEYNTVIEYAGNRIVNLETSGK